MYYVGIDVGGTNTKACLIDDQLTVLSEDKIKTGMYVTATSYAEALYNLCLKLFDLANLNIRDLTSIGIGIPGVVDIRRGSVVYSVNMPFRSIKLRSLLKPYINVPIYLENDANCSALGEFYLGAGKGTKRFVTISLGTGVGAGIIHNGKIYHGGNGAAGELGHHVIQKNGYLCPCGRKGCWEQYSSVTALKRMTKEAAQNNPESILAHIIEANNGYISGKTVFDAVRLGDTVAINVVNEFNSYLATGISNVINIFQPDVLAIAGGLSNEDDSLLLDPIRNEALKESIPYSNNYNSKIVKAVLQDRAGVLGAALLGKNKRI